MCINGDALVNHITEYFNKMGIKSVAFYGDGELRRYIDMLLKKTGCEIKYIVEDFSVNGIDYPRFTRVRETFDDVDCVIVTDVFASDVTLNKIRRTNNNCITAEKLLI